MDPSSGAPTLFINDGPKSKAPLGWQWSLANNGAPIAKGAAPASNVMFGDIDGDGIDDYLVLQAKTGALSAYLTIYV